MSHAFKGRFKIFLSQRWIALADGLVRASQALPFLIGAELQKNPHVSAKLFPNAPTLPIYIFKKTSDTLARDEFGLPIPPPDLWVGYGKTVEAYLNSGKIDVAKMLEILRRSDFRLTSGQRVMEFGCAAARMLRWLHPYAKECELWGVDISAPHIEWCAEFLAPPFHFVTTTTFPHLPFEDRSFDLIFAGSVMTHISDLSEAWLLELRRLTRPGGFLYLTIHDTQMMQDMLAGGDDFGSGIRAVIADLEAQTGIVHTGFEKAVLRHANGDEQIFYDTAYVRERWSRWFLVKEIVPRAYGYQTAVILQREL